MCTMPILLPEKSIAVSVVPMPSSCGLASTVSRSCWLAVLDGAAQRVDQGVAGDVLVERRHGADDDVAGDVTGGHAAHAVGDGEQPRAGVDGILVSVSDQTAVAVGRIAQGQSHGRNSREVRPMRIGTPRGTGVGPVTLARSR